MIYLLSSPFWKAVWGMEEHLEHRQICYVDTHKVKSNASFLNANLIKWWDFGVILGWSEWEQGGMHQQNLPLLWPPTLVLLWFLATASLSIPSSKVAWKSKSILLINHAVFLTFFTKSVSFNWSLAKMSKNYQYERQNDPNKYMS
jgi:hypothetical protein